MHTCKGVALLVGHIVQTAVAVIFEVVFYGLIVKGENRIVAIGSQHREIRRALQQGDKIAHSVAISLQELCGCHFTGLVVVLWYIVVVIDTACDACDSAKAEQTSQQ